MSDETQTEETQTEETQTEEGPTTAPATPQVGLQSLLTRGSDVAARPGFRSPSNSRSKATKKKTTKKKGKKKR